MCSVYNSAAYYEDSTFDKVAKYKITKIKYNMAQYIDKAAVVAEIKRIMAEEMSFFKDSSEAELENTSSPVVYTRMEMLLYFLDTLEMKEIQKKNLYVVTRCEEHSDYVEKVFFSEEKAENYCKQFEGNEDAYGREITEIEVDYPLEVKKADLEKEVANWWDDRYKNLKNDYKFGKYNGHYMDNSTIISLAQHFYELGLAQKEKRL